MWRNWNTALLPAGHVKVVATMENNMKAPQKLKIELPYNPAIPLLGIYSKQLKSRP